MISTTLGIRGLLLSAQCGQVDHAEQVRVLGEQMAREAVEPVAQVEDQLGVRQLRRFLYATSIGIEASGD
jgi:hypothetical protein